MNPKIEVIFKKDAVKLRDITGFYHIQDNPGGWGAPNVERIDITEAFVELSNGTESLTVDVLDMVNASTDEFIDFGEYLTSLSDGIFDITYRLKKDAEVFESCIRLFTMRKLDCCIDEKIKGIIKNEHDKMYMDKVMVLSAYRDALCLSALSMSENRIEYFMNKLKHICDPCATVK